MTLSDLLCISQQCSIVFCPEQRSFSQPRTFSSGNFYRLVHSPPATSEVEIESIVCNHSENVQQR